MFVKIPGLSEGGYLAYAYVTYILFGMLYTGINIPYGSLAAGHHLRLTVSAHPCRCSAR